MEEVFVCFAARSTIQSPFEVTQIDLNENIE